MLFFIVVIVAFICAVTGETDEARLANANTRTKENGFSDVNLNLKQSSLFYGVVSEPTTVGMAASAMCQDEMLQMLIGVNRGEMWAIKALDASGTSRHSFVWGQNAWLGSKTQCDYLNDPPKFSLINNIDSQLISAVAPIRVEFKMLFVNFTSPYKIDSIIHMNKLHRIGLCLPESCRNDEVKNIAQTFLSRKEMSFQKLFNVNAHISLVRNMQLSNFLQQPIVWKILVGIAVIVLCVISLSVVNDHKTDKETESFSQYFSLVENVKSITRTVNQHNSLGAINGIRAFVCIWVMIIHVGFYSIYSYDNVPALLQTFDGITMQPVYAGFFYVDIFFVLSALLLVFNFLTNETKMNAIRKSTMLVNLKTFSQSVLHRYVRLTPAFVFTIAVSQLLSIYLKESSSFYVDDKHDFYCTRTGWWHSVFYVQNLFAVYDMCLTWSWYLACDIQFYIIVLMILYLYTKYPKVAVFIYSIVLISVLAVSFYICQQANIIPKVDMLLANLDVFYTPPWMRAHPYLAGVLVGFVMVRLNDCQLKLKNWIVKGYWLASAVVFLCTLYVLYFKDISSFVFAIAYSMGRFMLALFWGSAIIMCYLGYGGVFNRFFSCQLLTQFNKLTYVMYLLNPVVIAAMKAGAESSDHFDMPSILLDVICALLLTYVAAFCVAPIFEIPFQRLSDRYVMQKKRKTSQ